MKKYLWALCALGAVVVIGGIYTAPTLKEQVDRITFVSEAHADTLPKECVGSEASKPENKEFCKEVAELDASLAEVKKVLESFKSLLEVSKRITDDIEQRNKLELERLRAPKK